jgi:riboflavin kinase/FMN adenylyltransferase
MLKTVWLTDNRDLRLGSTMLLGGFDGLHVGHRLLLARAKASGFPVGVMTIVGGKDGQSLFTFTERERIFKENGVDFVFELPFDEIKDLSPIDFLEKLTKAFKPKLFVCGEDFRFGKGAAGIPSMIETAMQVRVEILPLVEKNGEKVSSRTIKSLLKDGRVEEANELLKENYFLVGEVISDRQIGRTIGFPTANVRYAKEKFPIKTGVYETRVNVDGKTYKGITNYGARPTFDNEEILTETYLDGFDGDLYGRTIKVEFVRYLRPIQKFDSAESLKAQLKKDIACVREG